MWSHEQISTCVSQKLLLYTLYHRFKFCIIYHTRLKFPSYRYQFLLKSHPPVYQASLAVVKVSSIASAQEVMTTMNHTVSQGVMNSKERERRPHNLKRQLEERTVARELDLLMSVRVTQFRTAVKREKGARRMHGTPAVVVRKM